MKVAGLYGIQDIRIIDMEKPVPGPGELLMKVKAATTCGTDLKTYLRGYPGREFPLVPWGHECAGVVDAIGEGVTKFKKGDRITISIPAPCFHCYYCKKLRYDLCENITMGRGAYAEYVIIPAVVAMVNTFIIPDHMSFAQAALVEPLSSTVQGFVRAGGASLGDSVVVLGSGFQGLGHIQLSRLSGAVQVIAVDMAEYRLEMAKAFGATEIVNAANEDVEKKVKELTDGRGCDLVIEAVGTVPTWELAVRLARKGGTVLEYGGCAKGTTFTMDTGRLHYDGLTITGCTHKTPQFTQMAWELIKSGSFQTKPLISREMPLDDIKEAFRMLTHEKNAIKIAIIP